MPHRTGCLFFGSWGTVSLICASLVCGCLFCASQDTGYLIWASHGWGCLFGAQQGRGVYCVPPGAQGDLIRFTHTGHCMSVDCMRRQSIFIMCARGLGCLLCVPQGRGIYFVPHRIDVSILCFLGHSVCNMCLTCM